MEDNKKYPTVKQWHRKKGSGNQTLYTKKDLKEAFEAGRMRGRDEMYTSANKYPHEITKPDFKTWIKKK